LSKCSRLETFDCDTHTLLDKLSIIMLDAFFMHHSPAIPTHQNANVITSAPNVS